MTGEFNPDWTIHPGIMLRDAIAYKRISQAQLARDCGVSAKHVNFIIKGRALWSARMAVKLSELLGASPQFWWNLRCNYELDLALGRKEIR